MRLAPGLFNGTRKDRVQTGLAMGAWFCMTAFIASCLTHYLDMLVTFDLNGSTPALVVGVISAIIVAIKTA